MSTPYDPIVLDLESGGDVATFLQHRAYAMNAECSSTHFSMARSVAHSRDIFLRQDCGPSGPRLQTNAR